MMQPEHETLLMLLKDPNHWIFELILMGIFDLLIGAILWPLVLRPRLQRWHSHHKGDDNKIEKLERKVAELEARMNREKV